MSHFLCCLPSAPLQRGMGGFAKVMPKNSPNGFRFSSIKTGLYQLENTLLTIVFDECQRIGVDGEICLKWVHAPNNKHHLLIALVNQNAVCG